MSAVNLANVNIIDADGHVLDRDANLRKFIPEPYCRRRGSLLPNDVWDSSMYGKLTRQIPDVRDPVARYGHRTYRYFRAVSHRRLRRHPVTGKRLRRRFCRGYNDWIASVCAESPRLKGVALVPFQDVDAAAKETQRAIGELGLAGVTVGTFGMKEHLGQPMYWPIYEQLEKFNVPAAGAQLAPGTGRRNPLRHLLISPYHWTAL